MTNPTQRRLLTVHAHPDDEASKGAATVAKNKADGGRSVLVCCTGGEEGSILNEAMNRPEIVENLAEVRRQELALATKVIGYDDVVMLGYRDSGMPDSEANARSDCFHRADLDEAVGRLVAVIRRERPHVVITYSDDQKGYQHPDHIKVHEISVPAFERAGDPEAYPDLGEPWQPLKLYYCEWSRRRIESRHQAFLELGLESPYDEGWFERRPNDERITTRVPIRDYFEARTEGLRAHATQVDPESSFWFGLPFEVDRDTYPFDDYHLAKSLVETELPEDDVFAGIAGLER